MDFVIRSRRVVTPEGIRRAAVHVRDGRIVEVRDDLPGLPVEDLGDAVLFPGLVDTHVHVNEPGRTEWEGFATATRAAAVGGITTIADMPLNCIPVTTTAEALAHKLEAARPRLWVDCAFWGGVVPGNAPALPALLAAGAAGCKCFLVHSGIDDFPDVSENDLLEAMPLLAEHGVPLLVHAELELPTPEGAIPPSDHARWLHSRPRAWEDAAIALMIRLCEETGCRVHIVHLSSATALPMLRKAREAGLPITVETCPHYLCLVAEEVPDGATEYKCAPPIRESENREALWQGLADGTIDFVISDHSPCTPKLKAGDFVEAWGGISSLQLGLSTVWTAARRRGFGLQDVARWMSAAPADFLGVGDRKGRIAPGYDADLVAWDPDVTWTITPECLHHRHKVSPWVGREVGGEVLATWLRGEKIAERGVVVGGPSGRPLLRSPS